MINFKSKEYCLYGFKYFYVENERDIHVDNVAYTFDEKMNPTRDANKAKVIMLDSVVIGNWEILDNRISFHLNGFEIHLIKKEGLQEKLNVYPLPRKGISKMTRGNVYAKYNGHCAYCGCELKLDEMQVDHLVAHMMHGGEDTLDNYMPSCAVCNRVKSISPIEQFKEHIRHCGEIHRKRKKPMMADSDKIAIKYGLTEQDHEITLYYEKETKL